MHRVLNYGELQDPDYFVPVLWSPADYSGDERITTTIDDFYDGDDTTIENDSDYQVSNVSQANDQSDTLRDSTRSLRFRTSHTSSPSRDDRSISSPLLNHTPFSNALENNCIRPQEFQSLLYHRPAANNRIPTSIISSPYELAQANRSNFTPGFRQYPSFCEQGPPNSPSSLLGSFSASDEDHYDLNEVSCFEWDEEGSKKSRLRSLSLTTSFLKTSEGRFISEKNNCGRRSRRSLSEFLKDLSCVRP